MGVNLVTKWTVLHAVGICGAISVSAQKSWNEQSLSFKDSMVLNFFPYYMDAPHDCGVKHVNILEV